MSDPASPEPISNGSDDCPRGSLLLAVVTLLMMLFGALVRAPQAGLEVRDAVALAHAADAGGAPDDATHDEVPEPGEHEDPGVEPEPDEKLAWIAHHATTARSASIDCGAAAQFEATPLTAAQWSRQAARAPPRS